MDLKTRLRSTAARYFSSERYLTKLQTKARRRREKNGDSPVVYYFHQVDDPYSHLAIQKLDLLKESYDLPFQPFLVSRPQNEFLGSADHFDHWAYRDAQSVAYSYDVEFDPKITHLEQAEVTGAIGQLISELDKPSFATSAFEVGKQLWAGQNKATSAPSSEVDQTVNSGNQLRQTLGHYQGGMFYFDGEWFWGIDRIRSLEKRLIKEGFARHSQVLVPQPAGFTDNTIDTSGITLDYFPSLRSPYTAIGHQRLLEMVQRTGVQVNVKPVMPMLMRGIPAPQAKQRYIITDAAREGREFNSPLGKVVDPFGEPVKKAFSLFPAVAELGKPMEFVSAYLQAAWVDGIDITKQSGLQQVISSIGLNWQEVEQLAASLDWESTLQDNLEIMLTNHLWGVPSFRVSGGLEEQDYLCWGQDRIWRVEQEITIRAQNATNTH